MAVATYEDVAVAVGRPISTPVEQAQVAYWLSGIELVIRGRLGDVSLLDEDVLKYVETEAVAEKVRRLAAGGASSITVGVDDGNVTRRFENAVSATDITDEWWNLLEPDVADGAFTVSPYSTRQSLIGSFRGDWQWA